MDCIKMVVTMNPCKCGYYPDRSRCRCSEGEVRRYLHRISRPLLDRIDLHAAAQQIQYDELAGNGASEETTEQIRERVLRAHEIQMERYRDSPYNFNAQLPASALARYCPLGLNEERHMKQIYEHKHLTARSYHKLIRTARTIADLDGSGRIELRHLSEAVLYRPSEYLM